MTCPHELARKQMILRPTLLALHPKVSYLSIQVSAMVADNNGADVCHSQRSTINRLLRRGRQKKE